MTFGERSRESMFEGRSLHTSNPSTQWKYCKNCKRSVRKNHKCTIRIERKARRINGYEECIEERIVESYGEFKCSKCKYSTHTRKGLNNHKRRHKGEYGK